MSKLPFLLNFPNKVISLNNLGGGLDFRANMVKVYGKEILSSNYDEETILILTRIHDQEADMVGLELASKGINYIRINIDEVPQKYNLSIHFQKGAPKITIEGPDFNRLYLTDVDVVWLRRFVDYDNFGYRSNNIIADKYVLNEWKYLFDSLYTSDKVRWINHPQSEIRLNKIKQLEVAASIGMVTLPTLISNDENDIRDFRNIHKRVIAKTMYSHYVEHNEELHSIFGKEITEDELEYMDTTGDAPVIYQKFVPDAQEVRVTVIGNNVFSALIPKKSNTDDWHRDEIKDVKLIPIDIPDELKQKCLSYISSVKLDYGAFDFMLTEDNEFIFLEVNPTGDWRWVEICTNQAITDTVVNHLIQKAKRCLN